MDKKIDLKKVASLGLSLGIGLSMAGANSLASSRFITRNGDANLYAKMYGDPDLSLVDEEEDQYDCEEEENICDIKAKECLEYMGYDEGEITVVRMNLLIWNVARKNSIKKDELIYNYLEQKNKDVLCEGIEKEEIEKYIRMYGEEVIDHAFLTCGMYYNFYDVAEIDFFVSKYVYGNNDVIDMACLAFEIHEDLKEMLNKGLNLEEVDFAERSFKILITHLKNVSPKEYIEMFIDNYIYNFEEYVKRIESKEIKLSESAESYKNECKEFLASFK